MAAPSPRTDTRPAGAPLPPPPRRVAFFGGTFDPPHNAHLALAHAAWRSLALDEVRWVPAGVPWQKARRITPAADRVAMVEAAIRGEPRFVLDRIEIDRDGPSFTIDTVRALAASMPGTEWMLLLGEDQLVGLHTWREWPELLQRVTLAVAGRPGVTLAADAQVLARARIVPVPMAPMPVSATDIRARAATGRDISDLVPPEVAGYIARHHLYLDSEPRS